MALSNRARVGRALEALTAGNEAPVVEPAGAGPKAKTGPGPGTGTGTGPKPKPEPEPATSRYYGRVELDPQRVNRDVNQIVEEVLQHLTGLTDTGVEVTLEIKARRPEGFDERTIRTVSENSRTLKFDHFGFEKE